MVNIFDKLIDYWATPQYMPWPGLLHDAAHMAAGISVMAILAFALSHKQDFERVVDEVDVFIAMVVTAGLGFLLEYVSILAWDESIGHAARDTWEYWACVPFYWLFKKHLNTFVYVFTGWLVIYLMLVIV